MEESPQNLTQGETLFNAFHAIVGSNSTIRSIDSFFDSDGQVSEAFYSSAISYSIRRMLHSIYFRLDEENISLNDAPESIEEIKNYLIQKTSIHRTNADINKFAIILYSCLKEANKKPSKAVKKTIIKKCADSGKTKCYICGKEVNFTSSEGNDSPEIEHLFPRSLGGNSDESNLILACRDCNQQKSNYMGYADYHFEHISTKYSESDNKFKRRILKRPNSLAIKSKEGYSCSLCDKPAGEIGELKITRKDSTDSWHFMNIILICSTCNTTSHNE